MPTTEQIDGGSPVADHDTDPRIRPLTPSDGAEIWRMVEEISALEANSAYCYVLFSSYFGDTCLIAEDDNGRALGFVVGFRPPRQGDTVFVWQVGVLRAARGLGLGRRLLSALVEHTAALGVRYLEATVTPDNQASRALFRSLARELDTECSVSPFMGAELFPGEHEPEELFRIGPFGEGQSNSTTQSQV